MVDQAPDYMVVGEGRTFNLELVEAATRMVLAGSKLVATNLDPSCPTDRGVRPGCGVLVALLEAATGVVDSLAEFADRLDETGWELPWGTATRAEAGRPEPAVAKA